MQIILLTQQPDPTLPQGQAEVLQLLRELATDQQRPTLGEIVRRCNLPSPLAYWSRLRHLEAKGLIRVTNPTLDQLPVSSLLSRSPFQVQAHDPHPTR